MSHGHGTVTRRAKFLWSESVVDKRRERGARYTRTRLANLTHTRPCRCGNLGCPRKLPFAGSTPYAAGQSAVPSLQRVLTALSFHPALGYTPSPAAALLSFRTSHSYAFFIPPMSERPSLASQPSVDTLNRPSPPRKWLDEVRIHITRHVGVGVICSVAYFDPCVSFHPVFSVPRLIRIFFSGETGAWIYRQAQNLGTNFSSSSYWQGSLP